jgi:hypothetical protein
VRRVLGDVSPVDRAQWLAELAAAIDDAQHLAWRLGVEEGDSAEAKELYERLEGVRIEVDALRRTGFHGARPEPFRDWSGLLPWGGERLDPAT